MDMTNEVRTLLDRLSSDGFSRRDIAFYMGVSYRTVMLWQAEGVASETFIRILRAAADRPNSLRELGKYATPK